MEDLAGRAVHDYLGLADHRDRVVASACRILETHADLIERLGR